MRRETLDDAIDLVESEINDVDITALRVELAKLRHDAACWRRLNQEMVFHVGGPLLHESAIVRHHLSQTERQVTDAERARRDDGAAAALPRVACGRRALA